MIAAKVYDENHPADAKVAQPGRVVFLHRGHDVIRAAGIAIK